MQMNGSLEQQFNSKSDDTEGGAPDAAANREARRMRSRGKVIEYKDASPELKAEMEQVMSAIDNAPDDFDAVMQYGFPPIEELGKLADGMLKVQGKFDAEVNVMADALTKMQGTLSSMGLEKLAEATKSMALGIVDVGAKGAKGLGKLTKGIWETVSGKRSKQTEDQKLIEEMQNNLPALMLEMFKMTDNIAKTEKGLGGVMTEAGKLGAARVEATRQLNVYLGAAPEVMRRYDEVYIPEARKDFDVTGDPEAENYLNNVIRRQRQFAEQVMRVETARAASVQSAEQLRQMLETMEDQRAKMKSILTMGQNEWKAMMTGAGIAGSMLKAAQAAKKADEFGDKLHEQTLNMIEEAHQMTLDAKARGTIDPEKLIEAATRMQKMLDKENDAQEKFMRELEGQRQRLRGSTDKLIEAADVSKNQRMLEAAGEDHANDDKPQATPAAARRQGGPKV
jgi:uncharacterized protein YaaN involved in tellurite resistance